MSGDEWVDPLLDPQVRREIFALAQRMQPKIFESGYVAKGYSVRDRTSRSIRRILTIRLAGERLGYEVRAIDRDFTGEATTPAAVP